MSAQILGRSVDLHDSGLGIRFTVEQNGERKPAFAIRYQGTVYAYLNQCSHLGIPLDIRPGNVFDASGELLICAAHGATYAPDSGACAGGPCFGEPLPGLSVYEDGGKVVLDDLNYKLVPGK
ncbi:MAG TPA: (2Fe-2S)-binding protein [Gammaproteobacteria bacterium]|jgi:nitrite reductase/ring-hydroxylating ferredoxin subunit|nr:(2Fe-2S)-binding protein [Gammaproteobacteria bacterium]